MAKDWPGKSEVACYRTNWLAISNPLNINSVLIFSWEHRLFASWDWRHLDDLLWNDGSTKIKEVEERVGGPEKGGGSLHDLLRSTNWQSRLCFCIGQITTTVYSSQSMGTHCGVWYLGNIHNGNGGQDKMGIGNNEFGFVEFNLHRRCCAGPMKSWPVCMYAIAHLMLSS